MIVIRNMLLRGITIVVEIDKSVFISYRWSNKPTVNCRLGDSWFVFVVVSGG